MADSNILDVNEVDGVTVVGLRVRDLGETKIQQMAQELDSLVMDPQRQRLVIDLGAVGFLTSSAIGILIATQKKLHANDKVLKLCSLSPDIHSMFKITQVDRLFDIQDNADAAVQSFSG